MKTAIYIEDGTYQLVITPETEFEKKSIVAFQERTLDAKIFYGSFYDCRGGWVRQTAMTNQFATYFTDREDKSLIITARDQTVPLPTPPEE